MMRRIFAPIGAALAVLAATPAARSDPLGQVVPSGQGPWVAFVLLFGGLAVAILLIAAFGGGVGPRPTIGAPPPDAPEDHEHHEPDPGVDNATDD